MRLNALSKNERKRKSNTAMTSEFGGCTAKHCMDGESVESMCERKGKFEVCNLKFL